MTNMIDEMADLLHRKGWIKERFCSPAGFCLAGAAMEVASRRAPGEQARRAYREAMVVMRRTIEQLTDGHEYDVTRFNDSANSIEDIDLMLKHASQRWDEQIAAAHP